MQDDVKPKLTDQDKAAMEAIGRAAGRVIFGAKDMAEVNERLRQFNEAIGTSGFVVLPLSEPSNQT